MTVSQKVAISGAVACFILASTAPLLVWISYWGAGEVGLARSPLYATIEEDTKSRFTQSTILIDDAWISIYSISPIDLNSPPPPGLDKWPSPGEAYVSPALNSAKWRTLLNSQFGEISGVISATGLAAANEQFIYSRPALSKSYGLPAAGFGSHGLKLGIPDNLPLPAYSYIFVALLTTVPGTILLVAVRLRDRNERYREEELLRYMGARTLTIFKWNLSNYGSPVLIGASCAIGVLAWWSTASFRPPFMDWSLTSWFVRAQWRPLLIAVLLLAVAALIALILPTRSARLHKDSIDRLPRSQVILGIACLIIVLIAVNWSIQLKAIQLLGPGSSPPWLYVYFLGGIGVVLTFPALLRWLGSEVLGLVNGNAWRHGRVASIIAFRNSGAYTATRPTMGLAATSLIISLIVSTFGNLSDVSREALINTEILGEKFQELSFQNAEKHEGSFPAAAGLAAVRKVLASLPGVEAISVTSESQATGTSINIRSTPAGLHSLGLTPGTLLDFHSLSKETILGLSLVPSSSTQVMAEDPLSSEILTSDSDARIILFRPDKGPVDDAALRKALYPLVGINVSVRTVGDSGYLFNVSQVAQIQHYVLSLSIAGLLMLGAAFWLLAFADVRRESRRIAAFAVLGWERKVINGILTRIVVGPAVLVSAVTFVMVIAINYPTMWNDQPAISPVLTASIVALLPLAGSIVTLAVLRRSLSKSTGSVEGRVHAASS